MKQAEYNLVRLQTVELLNIQIDRKSRIKSPDKLWQFPWDAKAVFSETDRRRAKYFTEKVKRIEQRHG